MQEIIEYQRKYRQFKVGLDTEFRNAAESFVRIGYKLKEARDTDVLKGSQLLRNFLFDALICGIRQIKSDYSRTSLCSA